MLNKFLVAGRMTADPEIQTKGENRLCKFTIACERQKRKGEEKPETDFFTCIAWNRNADVVADWFGKGDIITLVGSVHINHYEKNGEKCNTAEVKVEEIDYIPSDINLANAETLMVTMISKEYILRKVLSEDVISGYDFVLIDCLPSLGTLLINALTAADRVLIPVQTQKFSMDGLQSLEALTQLVKVNTNPKLNLVGVLPTMVDRTKVSRTAMDTLNEKYGDMLFRTSISKSIEAAKSSENGTPLCMTAHKLGMEYDELAQEVLSRC